MKFRWDVKYLYSGITGFIVLALAILFYNGIDKLSTIISSFKHLANILTPVIYGLVIAYLLTPIINFLEKKVIFRLYDRTGMILTEKKRKMTRGITVFISLTISLFLIYGLLYMLIPQLIDSITSFIASAPAYLDNFQAWALDIMRNNQTLEDAFVRISEYFIDFLNGLLPQVRIFLTQIYSGIFDFIVVIKNVFIGFIISIYLLNGKETFTGQCKKLVYAILSPSKANYFIHSMRFVHNKFSGFIVGKIIDSIIIGILCYIVTSFMHTPYNVLVSVIIGVTNVIPFFGPYIGAIPTTLLILLVDPLQAIYFVIFIIILQTFDGNILGPRILSESTDLTSFWIIFAILIMGGLFGIIGMFIGVPVFAVLYAAVAKFVNDRLKARNMPTTSETYLNLNHINLDRGSEDYGEFVYFQEEEDEVDEKKKQKRQKGKKQNSSSDQNGESEPQKELEE